MKVITTAVIKGGTGKTTTAAALSQAAAASGTKVLAIDLDPQGNLTQTLGGNQDAAGSLALLHGRETTIQKTTQGVDLIAAHPDLVAERTTPASAMRLQNALEALRRKYAFVFVDTPPQMGELTFNGIQAANMLLVPLETDRSSILGLYKIADIANAIRKTNPKLKAGIVVTKYDGRPKLARYMLDEIRKTGEDMGAPVLGVIRSGISVREAQAFQESLFEYAPKSKPAEDYMQLFQIIKGAK